MFRSRTKRLWFGLAAATFLLGFALLLVFYVNTPRTSDNLPAVTATQALTLVDTAVPALPATEPLRPVFAFGILGEIDSIAIVDNTNGLGGLTSAIYTLQRQENIFKGTATFSVALYNAKGSAVREINLQPEPATTFLQMLEAVVVEPPVVAGTQQALPTMSDCDYPNPLSIELRNAAHETLVQFKATGCLYSYPWAVTYAGRKFDTYSDVPAQALSYIETYMRKDVFDALRYGTTPAP